MTVDKAHKFLESVLGMEHLLLGMAFFIRAEISQCNLDTGIEIGQLSHALGNDVVFINCCGEHCRVWPKLLSCATQLSLSHHLDRIKGLALFILLLIDFAITENL